jgi:predicted GNAT family N-acyltransferase
VVGLAALKTKRKVYSSRIGTLSMSSIGESAVELGYIAVCQSFRAKGLGSELLDKLLGKTEGPLFATTSSNTMKRMLRERGFRKTGKTWQGKSGSLSLWQRK